MLLLLPVLAVLAIAVIFFFQGQSTSVNIYHICGIKVGWYDAMFLTPVNDKSGCEKYGPVPCSRTP